MTEPPRIAVVGAGLLGSALTLRLSEAGARVTLLERAASAGGLAGTMTLGGSRIDRFYHVIVPSDGRMLARVEELGLSDRLHFSPVGAGFFIDGRMHPFNGLADFARFTPLSPTARLRLAGFLLRCQLIRDHTELDRRPLVPWLRRHCGDEVTDRIWRPLLASRFDGDYDELPATYLWARINRMRSARRHGGPEEMGALDGGHETLVGAMLDRARGLGAELRLGANVQGLELDPAGRVRGVYCDDAVEAFDQTIVTLQPPGLRHLLPPSLLGLLDPYPTRYLGVVCLVLKVRRSVVDHYSVNVCDPTPITTVVETSHVVGTAHTGGARLLYLPKYCSPGAVEFSEADASILERFTAMLSRIAPAFDPADILDWTVQRAPTVEPVHALGHVPPRAPVWPDVPGLVLASASQVYPRLLNGESILELADTVADQILARLAPFAAAPVPA